MITELNRIKQNTIFKSESEFFISYKNNFVQSLTQFLESSQKCKCALVNKETFSSTFYDVLFDPNKDCFEKHLCWINSKNTGFFFSSLMYNLIEAFMQYKKDKEYKQCIELVRICNHLQEQILSSLKTKKSTFDISPYLAKKDAISYLHNMYRLERPIKFITHNDLGTTACLALVKQIGQHSAVVQVNNEQITMIVNQHSSFILKNHSDEKNFSVKTEILCAEDNTILITDLEELENSPLLSRKYPRAAIIHASLVHIANEKEYISGNMIDLSEGGMGIMSSTKSHFEKGQDIVAFVSYEDEDNGFKVSFEANGIITSIIGIEHVFRYGIQLFLEDNEKEIIHNLVEVVTSTNKKKNNTTTKM
ncbi:PilZ domain-containing protein [Sulfurospirillum arcachonense]|uniref:PilZ domain-containing protein n=1 Tax=Sulfurospirillum arcachonense TaxID=57666 RepID=UPI00046A763B|nr:PilZ domain-containing protein [Sulfurospirillum arcachonense]